MNHVRTRAVAPGERRKLHQMKSGRFNAVNLKHARVILLSSGRVGNQEIAQRVGCSVQWVRQLIHRFNQCGLDGIRWEPSDHAGNATKFDTTVVNKIIDIVLSSPRELIGLTQWSLRKLREYLITQGILQSISVEWLRRLLRRGDVLWRRTKTWKQSNDPLFWEKYRRIERLQRSRPAGGKRISIDEFGPLNLQPRHGWCVSRKGSKGVERLPATYRRYEGVRHFLALYDLETGRLEGRFYTRKRALEFLDFLKWIRQRYRSAGTLHVILDNYGTHLHAAVKQWAQAHRIKFYFTPSDASWLNPIESQFTELKAFALNNSDYRTHEQLQASIESFLAYRNGDRELAITSSPGKTADAGDTATAA